MATPQGEKIVLSPTSSEDNDSLESLEFYAFHEILRRGGCSCGCELIFTGERETCQICSLRRAERQWVYTRTRMGRGTKLVCHSCAVALRELYSEKLKRDRLRE